MIYKFFMISLLLIVGCKAFALTETDLQHLRDPFQYVHPNTQLLNFPQVSISHLTLVGSMVFGDTYYAFIAASPREMAWVVVGDSVGSEKAVVIDIHTEKIILKEQEKSYTKLWEIKKPSSVMYS